MPHFYELREELLRGGVAPRHVRRYLAELDHHYDDLLAEERAHGVTGAAASAAAIERLGSTEQLASALLAKQELRSITARYPWLVFVIVPPMAAFAGLLLLVITMALLAIESDVFLPDNPPHQKIPLPIPRWFGLTLQAAMFAVNFLIVPLLGTLLTWMAQRQRIRLIWPLLGMVLILVSGLNGSYQTGPNGRILLTLNTIIPWNGPFGPGGMRGIHWPTLLAQAALLCLPLAWLWRARHKRVTA